MTEIKRRKSGQFAKGHKGGPGRPRKQPDRKEPVTAQEITQRIFDFFDKHYTDAKLKELLSSKKASMEFLAEVRRLLPTLQAVSAEVRQEFKPLEIQVVNVEGSQIENERIKELEAQVTKQQRFIEAYEKALKEHGLVPTIQHDPERPLALSEGQDGTFKTDAEKHLKDQPEEDDEDDEYKGLPPADVTYSRR